LTLESPTNEVRTGAIIIVTKHLRSNILLDFLQSPDDRFLEKLGPTWLEFIVNTVE
jgi:hypothetical protein